MRWSGQVFCGVLLILATIGGEQADAQFGNLFWNQAGEFDYYVFSLSWSPEYCAGSPGEGSPQCSGERQFGFVVHGLWPQYNRGYPQFCRNRSRVDNTLIEQLLPLMLSERLIRHEWKKHGTCCPPSSRDTGSTMGAIRGQSRAIPRRCG